jgi:D-cysteine desulfhydrase
VTPGPVRLGQWPTPLHRLDRLASVIGSPPLYVKRDDLCGFGLAGTKARSLEHVLADALDRGCDTLVVGGGPPSNLVAAAAWAAAVVRLRCVAVLYGSPPRHVHPNLALTRWLGAELRFTGDPERSSVDELLPGVVEELAQAGARPYALPRGGATPVASVGAALAVEETAEQLRASSVESVTVVVATGSGGIHAGLLAGVHAVGAGWQVVGMSVSRPPHEVEGRVHQLATACAAARGWSPAPPSSVVVHDVRGSGYGVPSAPGREAARLAAVTEGLLLDPVYTAKAMAGLVSLVERGLDGPVLLWHTGGIAGALGGLQPLAAGAVQPVEDRHDDQ